MGTLVITDPKACGMGEGERCCAFLVFGGEWLCGRTMPDVRATVRTRLAEGSMTAKYDPGEVPFPECQRRREA